MQQQQIKQENKNNDKGNIDLYTAVSRLFGKKLIKSNETTVCMSYRQTHIYWINNILYQI